MFGFGSEKDKMQKWKNNNVYNTETMLPISEIRGDTIILKDAGLRAILRVTGLNIDLRNYDEQEVVVEQYKRFLNGLNFPIQIFIRNTYLELSDYIEYMSNHVKRIDNAALKEQWDSYIEFLDQINTKQWLIYVKEFYVVIPFYPQEDDVANMRKPRWRKFMDALSKAETPEKIVDRYRVFLKNDKYLETRVNVVMEWLKWVGMFAERLRLSEILSLLFKCYNPDAHKEQSEYVE